MREPSAILNHEPLPTEMEKKPMAKAITPEKIKETKKELATARKDAAALKRAVSAMQKAFMTDPNKENGGYYRSAVSDHIKAVNVVEKLSTKLDGMLAAD